MKLLRKFAPLSYLILVSGFTLINASCKKEEADPVQEVSAMDVASKVASDTLSFKAAATQAANSNSGNPLMSYYNFDGSKGSWFEDSMHYPYSAIPVDYVKKAGKSALKVELHKGENIRAELGTSFRTSTKEGWFGFSVYFPSNYVKDNSIESIVQWQAYPDFDLGETWRSAPLFLGVLNDRLILDMRNDPKKVTVQGIFAGNSRTDLGALEKNKWQDFVFHIIWAPDNTGLIQMWKNGKLVYEKKNKPTSYNDAKYPYFKIGIYKWDWGGVSKSTTKTRLIYIDEVRIGNAKANYNMVRPK